MRSILSRTFTWIMTFVFADSLSGTAQDERRGGGD